MGATFQTNSSNHQREPSNSLRARRGSFCCCSCRLGISSSSSSSSPAGERADNGPMSSLAAHAMVQERLDQIARGRRRKRAARLGGRRCKCIVMIAVDRESYDPREDFRRSMMEVIASNRIEGPKELRSLLKCYMSINSEECRPFILEAFHQACTSIFMCV